MRLHRRQFIGAAVALAASRRSRADITAKHLVAYSLGAAQLAAARFGGTASALAKSDPATYYLGGITQPIGFISGGEPSDWILVGGRDSSIPALTLDDLVVGIRARFLHGPTDPGVTIDPRGGADGANIQDVKFFAGIENTAFGQTCFEADWLMKRLGMKLDVVPVPGLETYYDLASKEAGGTGEVQIASRFWYVPTLNKVNVVKGVVFLEQFRSGILTEVLSAKIGSETVKNLAAFYHRPSEEFARSFEDHYAQIALERPVFARLESLTKLAGLAAGLARVEAPPSLPYWLSSYAVSDVRTPVEKEVLEYKDAKLGLRISGGVTMASMTANLEQGTAAAFRQLVMAARPDSHGIWEFDLEFDGNLPHGVSYPQGSTAAISVLALWRQAQFLMAQRRYEAAIALLDNIIEEVPGNQEPYNLRGLARSADGATDLAVKDFDKAIEIDPDFAEAYFNRANAHSVRLEYAEAVRDYSTAIKISPAMIAAYLNRGSVEARQRDKTAAMADYEKALSLNSAYAPSYFNRGLLRADIGDHEEALQDFENAIKFDSHLAKAYLERGSLLEAMGNEEEALKSYERFLIYDLPEEDQGRYSKEAVRSRAEELMKDIAIGPGPYEQLHHNVPVSERLRRARAWLGVDTNREAANKK
jgi:tetratricopeptide (TPR) repeat protein